MYSFIEIEVQKIEKTYSKINLKDHLEKNHCLIICSLNTIGFQQKILVT
jgi:hypothetical protein